MDRRQDLLVAIIIVLLGACYAWISGSAVGPVIKTEPLQAAFFPRVLAAVMIAGGLWVIIWERLRRWRQEQGNTVEGLAEADEPGHPVHPVRPLVLAGLLTLYSLGWTYLGYIAATFLAMFLGLLLLQRRDWKSITVISAGVSLLLYLIFAVVLGINIPLLPAWLG